MQEMYPSFLSIQSPLLLQLQLFTSKCQYLLSKAGAVMKKNCENIFYNENVELGATKTWYQIGLVQCHRTLGLYKPNILWHWTSPIRYQVLVAPNSMFSL